LVTSNHPGAADVLTILSLIARDDVKIVVSGVPFMSALSNAKNHFIQVQADPSQRSFVLREIITHLKNDGCVFMFPTGHVTPDPSFENDNSIVFEDWSESVSLVLHAVPKTQLLITICSGVIEPQILRSPLLKLRKIKWRQQILAEFLQIMRQMMRPSSVVVTPRVTVCAPITGEQLKNVTSYDNHKSSRRALHSEILNRAEACLKCHTEYKEQAVTVNL
jgi:hypothetical protein